MILEQIELLIDLNLRTRGARPSVIAFNPTGYYLFTAEIHKRYGALIRDAPESLVEEEYKGMKIIIVDPLDAVSPPKFHRRRARTREARSTGENHPAPHEECPEGRAAALSREANNAVAAVRRELANIPFVNPQPAISVRLQRQERP